jgi:hypothetical protein
MKVVLSLFVLLFITGGVQAQTRNKEVLYDEKGIKLSYTYTLINQDTRCVLWPDVRWNKWKVVARLENESGRDIKTGVINVSHKPYTTRNKFPEICDCVKCGWGATIKWNTVLKSGNYLEDYYEFVTPNNSVAFPKGDGNDSWKLEFEWINN